MSKSLLIRARTCDGTLLRSCENLQLMPLRHPPVDAWNLQMTLQIIVTI